MTSLVSQLGQEFDFGIRPISVRVTASVVDVSRPVQPWRWTSVLAAPLELVALTWSVPLVMLAGMASVGLAMTSLLWLGRQIVSRF